MVTVEELLAQVPNRLLLAGLVLLLGIVLGYAASRVNRRLLERAGVPRAVEGTTFERTARSVGTSTVSIVSALSMWFIIGVALLAALSVADIRFTTRFWSRVTGFLPELFFALLVLIVGVVVADKVELVVSERLRGIKLPQIGIIPRIVRYSIVYVAILIALSQIGVATSALIVLLFIYFAGLIFLSGLAFKDLLASGAAGMYLLLNQPYGIGDEVRFGEESGIVQEVTVFVTHIEGDEAEYIVPNRRVFERGVVRMRRE